MRPRWLPAKGKKKLTETEVGLRAGFRSGLEDKTADHLTELGVPFKYESFKIFYQPKPTSYTPDFLILANGIVVETKGRFVTADRTKHKLVKAQHPDIDIRFVFSRSATTLSKVSKTTYAKWCETNGFQFADKRIPLEWLTEPRNDKSLNAIASLKKE